mgnify:CR=1 FL=1|tara:strand:- start:10327 stop:11172 length:846 start_codon:yes stop_codon:yes gene_type:complete
MNIEGMQSNYIGSNPRIYYKTIGKGPPLIFLHGIGGNSSNWEEQQIYFSREYTTIAWDARGYGHSEDYYGPLTFSDFSKDLAVLLESLNIKKAHFVGLSMGARILMDFFSVYSKRVATLTLCDCYYSFEENFLNLSKRKKYIEIRQKPLLEGKALTDIAPKIIKSLVSPSCSENIKKKIYNSLSKIRSESYLKTIKEAINYDVTKGLSNFNVPVQLIFGEHDALTPPSLGESMKEKIINSNLDIIPNAGHLSNMEKPEIFNKILLNFLSKHKNKANYFGNK